MFFAAAIFPKPFKRHGTFIKQFYNGLDHDRVRSLLVVVPAYISTKLCLFLEKRRQLEKTIKDI